MAIKINDTSGYASATASRALSLAVRAEALDSLAPIGRHSTAATPGLTSEFPRVGEGQNERGRQLRRPYFDCSETGLEAGLPFSTTRVTMNFTGLSLELMAR